MGLRGPKPRGERLLARRFVLARRLSYSERLAGLVYEAIRLHDEGFTQIQADARWIQWFIDARIVIELVFAAGGPPIVE